MVGCMNLTQNIFDKPMSVCFEIKAGSKFTHTHTLPLKKNHAAKKTANQPKKNPKEKLQTKKNPQTTKPCKKNNNSSTGNYLRDRWITECFLQP